MLVVAIQQAATDAYVQMYVVAMWQQYETCDTRAANEVAGGLPTDRTIGSARLAVTT